MIDGFEDYTAPLSTEEQSAAGLFIQGFSTKIGVENAVTSQEIIQKLKKKGINLTGARVRKIINYIRVHKWVKNLVATSKGYYIENDPAKIREYQESLKQRAAAIMAVANSYN